MRACSMASGGVFFIADEIERKDCTKVTAPKNYRAEHPSEGSSVPHASALKSDGGRSKKSNADLRDAA